LRMQPEASSIDELQAQIDGFVRYYNEVLPHQAKGCPRCTCGAGSTSQRPPSRDNSSSSRLACVTTALTTTVP
jgi:hypothetical protein